MKPVKALAATFSLAVFLPLNVHASAYISTGFGPYTHWIGGDFDYAWNVYSEMVATKGKYRVVGVAGYTKERSDASSYNIFEPTRVSKPILSNLELGLLFGIQSKPLYGILNLPNIYWVEIGPTAIRAISRGEFIRTEGSINAVDYYSREVNWTGGVLTKFGGMIYYKFLSVELQYQVNLNPKQFTTGFNMALGLGVF